MYDGIILAAHCHCMAGLREACSHGCITDVRRMIHWDHHQTYNPIYKSLDKPEEMDLQSTAVLYCNDTDLSA